MRMSHWRLGVVVFAAAVALPGAAGQLAVAGASPPGPVPAVARAGTRVLASGPSGFPGRVDVVGSDASRVVFASEDQRGDRVYNAVGTYQTVPLGGGHPSTIGGGGFLSADGSVAGSTFVYFPSDQGQPYWIDLDTGRSGLGRTPVELLPGGLTWQTAVPGGGAWIDPDTDPVTLLTTTTANPNTAPTELAPMPGLSADAVAAAADTHGIAVVSGATVDYYSFATETVRRLDTGTASAKGFTCTSATATAVGCSTRTEVLRVPTDGSAPTVIPAAGVNRVVVGPTSTAWTVRSTSHLFTDTAGGITQTAFAVSGVTVAGNGFAFSRNGSGVAGVYRTASAAAAPGLLARPLPLSRLTFQVALTAGRVAWLDDSTVHYPVRSRRVALRGPTGHAAVDLGGTVVTNPGSIAEPPPFPIDSPASEVAVSGPRSLLVARGKVADSSVSGSVLLVDAAGRHVLGGSADGFVALSGSRAMWRTTTGRWLLRNLATGRTRDLTPIIGPGFSVALYGRYLVYTRNDRVWRRELLTGRSVDIGPMNTRLGSVAAAGDWVAWQDDNSRDNPIHYRDARTMGPIRSVHGGRKLDPVSQAGFITTTQAGRQAFRRWGTTQDRPLPSVGGAGPVDGDVTATGGITADGGLVAWIGLDDYPRVAPFALSAARPQALGTPFAAARVRSGAAWTIDQPTSQLLTSCTVLIRDAASRIVARLSCAATAAKQGDATATWKTRSAGANARTGQYSWQLVAGNRTGSILDSTGTPGPPVTGTLTVTR